MRAICLVVMLCPVLVSSLAAQRQLSLMPMPAAMQLKAGQLLVDSSFSVGISGHSDVRLQHAVEIFLDNLRRQTGMPPLDMKMTDAAQARLVVHSERASKDVTELGEDESYSLEIGPAGAKLDAVTTLGIMRGLQTFLQLAPATSEGFAVPAITIQDKPRFPWRGLMIDVGRHFIPLDVLKRNLDGMAAVKLNVFHWHLSENQGFRIESKKFPRLHQMGSDGLYYTQDEVRGLIAYARDRGIRVVPEFDMPGHSTAWFVGYPELASGPGPYQIERKWGVFDPAMDPTNERTYKFLDSFIGVMAFASVAIASEPNCIGCFSFSSSLRFALNIVPLSLMIRESIAPSRTEINSHGVIVSLASLRTSVRSATSSWSLAISKTRVLIEPDA